MDEVWEINRILSSAVNHIAAELAPKYAGPYFIAKHLGSYIHELVDQANNDVGKVHVVDFKLYHDEESGSIIIELRKELLEERRESPVEILTQFLNRNEDEPTTPAGEPVRNIKTCGRPR